MQVKILKCTEKYYWYNDYIGEIVDVVIDDHDSSYYKYIGDTPRGFEDELFPKHSKFIIKISDTIIFDRYKKIQKLLKNVNKNHKM